MTRDEVMSAMQTIRRTCRGPHVTREALAAMHPSRRRPIEAVLAEATARLAEPPDPPMALRDLTTVLLREGHRDLAARLDRVARLGCGADLNAVILQGPFDGERHEGTCPACGLAFAYRALYVADEGA